MHEYGPHSPENAANSVTVLTPAAHSCGRTNGHAPGCVTTRYPQEVVVPIPPQLRRQRELRDNRASAREVAQRRLAEAASMDLDAVQPYACSCGSWHFTVGGRATCPDGEPVGPRD